jgi:hypothetical protein
MNGNRIEPVSEITDPNQIPIAISNTTFILQFKDAVFLKVRDIDFIHATNMTDWPRKSDGSYECGYHPFIQGIGNIDISAGSHHITIENSEIVFGSVGITTNDCHHIRIQNCHLYQGFPDWITWRDVKGNANQPWPEFNCFAFAGELKDSEFKYNQIHHTMDGLYIKNGSKNSNIHGNYFWLTRDDAVNFETYVDRLDVSWNMLRHVFEGFSIVGYPYPNGANGGINGDVFIHNNVIDGTRYTRRDRQPAVDPFLWECGLIWGGHSCHESLGDHCENNVRRFGIGGDCKRNWTVYNNTIIAQRRNRKNQRLYPPGCKHFRNNIIYCMDDLEYSGCNYCDGNLVWQVGGNNENRIDSEFVLDPGFDREKITSKEYHLSKVWDIYLPTNERAFQKDINYPPKWPGSKNLDYFGAVPKSGISGK